jgi:hypothetical protein
LLRRCFELLKTLRKAGSSTSTDRWHTLTWDNLYNTVKLARYLYSVFSVKVRLVLLVLLVLLLLLDAA